MFEYFYHEILRKTIISFGTLFNNISIKHTNSSDNVVSVMKVPFAYGPTQKFLARLNQSPDLNKSFSITLPRISFEFTGLTYDPSRKLTTTQTFITKDKDTGTEIKKIYMPVPYNMQFELSIMSLLNDDALQIIEQILPYFQPAYNLTVSLVDSVQEKRDIPVILENVTMQDEYEGDFSTRRVLLYTLRFTAKTYLFGPVSSVSKDIIKSSKISYLTGTDTNNTTTREVVYTASPRAIKNYTGIVLTTVAKDFSVSEILVNVEDASGITVGTYLEIEGEELFVKSKIGNVLTVERGKDGTTITSHLRGEKIKSITQSDNLLIEVGDDFGFNGSTQ
jgi:hypothetical protein